VYGVVDDGFAAPPMLGVDDAHSLEVVRGATLGALASRVPLAEFGEVPLRERMEDLAWLERNARRHEQILEGVREQRATVVPMRLFTIYETDASLRDMLDREHEFLAAALTRLTCRTEWGVKLFAHAHGEELADLFAPEDADDADQPSGEERPGESYMLRRRSADRRHEAASRRLDGYRDAAHRRLATLSVEARVNPLQPPELSEHEGAMLMNGVYLVDDDAAEAFAAAVSSLQEDFAQDGIDVVLTGPWPPYNFVNSAQEAGV
jgi:hypothetical protein